MNDEGIVFEWCVVVAGLLCVLKWAGVIMWPWLWVLSPLWVPVVLGLVVLVGYILLMILGLALVWMFE